MRDPLSWSIPLFRAFGVQVKLHLLYILISLALLIRGISTNPDNWLDFVLIDIVLLFVIVLLHEFGHCFAARREGGEADQIVMWPLGGLALCEVPHTPRAHFNTAFGGPFVNILICLVAAAIIIPAGFLPPLNPIRLEQRWSPELYRWSDGVTAIPEGHQRFVKAGTEEVFRGIPIRDKDGNLVLSENKRPQMVDGREAVEVALASRPSYPNWVLWSARVFWMSWFLFLFNVLLPAFPLDGGRLLQSIIWGKTQDYRKGTVVAVYGGFITAIALLFVAFFSVDGTMLLGLSIFIFFTCLYQLRALEVAESENVFGYDFSQGYTSLERDEPPPPKQKKPGFIRRWLEARRQRRAQREAEQRAADERRMDELLDKIHREGKESLTDEEKRFMDRVSIRYRNKS